MYAILTGLAGVCRVAGKKITKSRPTLEDAIVTNLVIADEEDVDDDKARRLGAAAYGAFAAHLSAGDVAAVLEAFCGVSARGLSPAAQSDEGGWPRRYGRALLLAGICTGGGLGAVAAAAGVGGAEEQEQEEGKGGAAGGDAGGGAAVVQGVLSAVHRLLEDDRAPVRAAAVDAAGGLIGLDIDAARLIPALAAVLDSGSGDGKRAALRALKTVARTRPALVSEAANQAVLIPALLGVAKLKGQQFSLKLLGERALLAVLRVGGGAASSPALDAYMKTASSAAAKDASEYCRKVLSKLPVESDDED